MQFRLSVEAACRRARVYQVLVAACGCVASESAATRPLECMLLWLLRTRADGRRKATLR